MSSLIVLAKKLKESNIKKISIIIYHLQSFPIEHFFMAHQILVMDSKASNLIYLIIIFLVAILQFLELMKS